MAGFVKKCPCLRPQIEEDVRELDYRHCSLADVPSEVFNFERTLEELYVDSNQIRELPRELFYCHGIRKLSLSDNEITIIPPAIASFINLEELDISKNGIIDMPENIKCCKYLRSVDASVNPLGKLPDGFTQLLNLTQLFLNDTFLDYLPGNFGRLSRLKILEIRENHLKTLPKSFSRLTELERLDIGHNEFTELPDVIGNLTSLLELWCDHNQIAHVTPMIGGLKQLMFLDATKNRIQTLPNEIEGCLSLADLHLTSNCLQSLPDSIGNLENITTLKVDGNQLTSLPTTIGGLTALSELNVSRNDLEDIPASLGLLRNIRTLYADENYLTYIPAELGSCNGITVLSLRSNKLEYIPDELGRIPRLRVLNLSDNQLKCLPFTIVKLKELQALWLSENQTRPLVPLQSDHDPDTGRKILTCYLLPQGPAQDSGDPNGGGDTDSFHASIWDEERARRQQIHFEFGEELDEDGKLVRCPTPYPKEMREKIRHARNLAMMQKMSSDGHWIDGGEENIGFDRESGGEDMSERTGVRMREARITKPASPSLHETHKLYRCDKEKLARDKARMQQHRHSSPESLTLDLSKAGKKGGRGSQDLSVRMDRPDSPRKGKDKRKDKENEDDGGFSDRESHRSASRVTYLGSSSDITTRSTGVTARDNGLQVNNSPKTPQGFAYVSPKDIAMSFQQHNLGVVSSASRTDPYHRADFYHGNHHGGRRHRTRDYDSDTGYRSETEVIKFHRQQILAQHRDQDRQRGYESEREVHNRSQRDRRSDGYASDVDGCAGRTREHIAFRGFPLNVQQNSSSLPYDLNVQRQSYNSPQVQRNHKIMLKSDEMYQDNLNRGQGHSNSDARSSPVKSDGGYPPPSPSQFHKSKIVDQSTPVTPEPPQGIGFPSTVNEKSRSRSNSASGSQDDKTECRTSDYRKDYYTHADLQSSSNEHNKNQSMPAGAKPPPPYKPAPPYVQSPSQRKLPPNSNRNSPYSVYNYDRRSNHSPTMHHRVSEMTITEQSESRTNSTERLGAKCLDYNSSNVSQNFSNLPTPERIFSGYQSDSYAQKDYRYSDKSPSVPTNANVHHSYSHPPGSSDQDNDISYNYGSDPSTSTISASPDRSRTPVSGSYDDHRDSPRESGYSSREHSSHRNSPMDTPQKYEHGSHRSSPYDTPQKFNNASKGLFGEAGDSSFHKMSTYDDDVAVFKVNSEPHSQVSSSTDSGYGYGHNTSDRITETPTKYSVYSMHPSARFPATPNQYPHTPYSTPARGTNYQPSSRETTPDHTKEATCSPVNIMQNTLKGDKFHVTITKNPGLGFSIAGGIGSYGNPFRTGDRGIFVTKVQSEGPAAMSLSPGDKILEVNGHDFTSIHHDDAVSIMKNSKVVSMNIERVYTV